MELCKAFKPNEPHLYHVKIHSPLNPEKMNTLEIKGKLYEQKGKLKQKFAALTENNLMFLDGKKDELLGEHHTKLGRTKEQLEKIVATLY